MKTAASGDFYFSDKPSVSSIGKPMSVPIALKSDRMKACVRVNLALTDPGLSALIDHLHDVARKRADRLEAQVKEYRNLLPAGGPDAAA